jgi:Signal transduction histidine kinase
MQQSNVDQDILKGEQIVNDYINCFLGDLDVQHLELKNKITLIQQNMESISSQIENLSTKMDYNSEYFSVSQNEAVHEKERLKEEFDLLKNTLKDDMEHEANIQHKMKQANYVKKYVDRIRQIVDDKKSDELFGCNPFSQLKSIENFGVQILETQENERIRIARELHDSTVQNLTNLVHKTELCLKLVDIDTVRVKLELETEINSIRSIINDMRSIIYDLRPMSIDDLGLNVTIERYITRFLTENDEIEIEFTTENEEIKLLPIINITLFRIIQEACNNVKEHAGANKVMIHLIYNKDNIQLSIVDNGIGFDTKLFHQNESHSDKSFGLSIMKERIYLLSGKIDIISKDKEGTSILVSVPV